MPLFLHIGIGKTGTTSIQTFLEANAAALAERGLITPTSLAKRNHRRLTMYALNDDIIDNLRRAKGMLTPERISAFRKRTLKDFRAEVATWRPDQTIVMTSEQMTRLRRPGEIARLRDFVGIAGQNDIRIIVYLRRQDLYYVSEYSQRVKGGVSDPYQPDGEIVNKDIYFYDRLIGHWSEVFGRSAIIVRPFERSALKNGDAVDDFMSVVGIDDLTGLERPPARNPSLDAHTVEFLRRLNPKIPRWVNGKENNTRALLIEALEAMSDGPKLRMSHAHAERFLSLFAESNRKVAREYLGTDELFKETLTEAEGMEPVLPVDIGRRITAQVFSRAILQKLTEDQITDLTADAWNKFFPM